MKYLPLFLLFVILLAACGGMDGMNTETAVSDRTEAQRTPEGARRSGGMGQGMGMGNGMGGGMMARHHATIPEAYTGLTNPVTADEASLERGEEIYTTYCVVCHGEGGMGDGAGAANLDPAPAPLAHTSRMLGDDYLYWRVSEGGSHDPFNSAMPAWEDAFDETARWDVINYVRALGSGAVVPGGQVVQAEDHTEMLETAVSQSLITQTEADTFALVHGLIDEITAESAPESGTMAQNRDAILAALLDADKITQAQIDSFNDVHDRLLESGLMQ